MRKFAHFLIAAAVFSSMTSAQTLVENTASPLSEKAGRVVSLKEELRIEDTGEDFFFKDPYTIRVSTRGDLFIKDGPEQALQFDPQGRFIRNHFKKGQGPGELTSVIDLWASPQRLYLIGYPPKILIYDYEGNLVQEIPFHSGYIGSKFILADPTNILVSCFGRPNPAAGTGFIDIPWDIIDISSDGASFKTIASFPIRTFLEAQEGGAVAGTAWNLLHVVALDGNSLYVNHTPEYMVENFVRDKHAVVLRFRRPYARIKRSSGGASGSAGRIPHAPEYWPDIYALHIVDGHLWVQTMSVTKEKGILFDVFNVNGQFIDSFFIQPRMANEEGEPARTMTIAGGFAYIRKETSDGLVIIQKCRLIGL